MNSFLIDVKGMPKEEKEAFVKDLIKMVNLEIDADKIYIKIVDQENS